MGLETIVSGVGLISGVAGASRQAGALRAAAQQERETAEYNSKLSIYSGEVAAQKTQFDTEAQVQALERNRVLKEMTGDQQIQAQGIDSENKASAAEASLFGTVGSAANPLGEEAINQSRQGAILQKHALTATKRYEDDLNLYQQNEMRRQSTTQAFNQRQQAVFQSAAISAPAYAKAAKYDADASGGESAALFGGIGQLVTGPIGGLLGLDTTKLFGGGGLGNTSVTSPPLFGNPIGSYTNGINGPFNNPFGG